MMPNFVFKAISSVKIIFVKIFGSNLQKLLLKIADEYYSLLRDGFVHEEAIVRIMKVAYDDDKKKIEDCNYFVFGRKQTIDTIFDQKYGKRGRFLSHLFKLVQKVYLDKYLDDDRKSYEEELKNTMTELNKSFNKVVLYMFTKYDD
jgi:hypothetical protein